MKQILVVFFCLSVCVASAQTKLDSMVFHKVNEFRISKGLQKLTWDDKCWDSAHKHNVELVDTNRFSTHVYVISKMKTPKNESSYVFAYTEAEDQIAVEEHAEKIVQHWISTSKDSILDRKLKVGSISCSRLIAISFINFVAAH